VYREVFGRRRVRDGELVECQMNRQVYDTVAGKGGIGSCDRISTMTIVKFLYDSIPSRMTALSYGNFSNSVNTGGRLTSGQAVSNSCWRRWRITGLSRMWKLAKQRVDFMV